VLSGDWGRKVFPWEEFASGAGRKLDSFIVVEVEC
jgi:hypothetical protein